MPCAPKFCGVEQEFRIAMARRVNYWKLFFFDFDAEGFQELEVWSLTLNSGLVERVVTREVLSALFFALLADADGGLENEKNIVAAFFDAGDDFGDLLGIGKRFVDGFAKFLHEFFESIVHVVSPVEPCFLLHVISRPIVRCLRRLNG